jgi:excisionase family DNA binding protein
MMSSIPKDEREFRKWLDQESECLRERAEQANFNPSDDDDVIVDATPDGGVPHAELDVSDFEDAAATVREAGEIALRLHLPDAYKIVSKVRYGPLGLDLARMILSEVLRSVPETEGDLEATAECDIGPSEGPLTVGQAANRLGVSKEKVYGLCRERVMPHDRIGKRIVITLEHFAAFQKANQTPAATTARFRHI